VYALKSYPNPSREFAFVRLNSINPDVDFSYQGISVLSTCTSAVLTDLALSGGS